MVQHALCRGPASSKSRRRHTERRSGTVSLPAVGFVVLYTPKSLCRIAPRFAPGLMIELPVL
jgi:hypothetical protein